MLNHPAAANTLPVQHVVQIIAEKYTSTKYDQNVYKYDNDADLQFQPCVCQGFHLRSPKF